MKHPRCLSVTPVLILVAVLPEVTHGGRYSETDPTHLGKVVVPMVIVGIILLIMLILLAVFYYRKKRPLCSCICCREFCSKHTRMTSGTTKCSCTADKIVISHKMCEMCVKWQSVPNGLLSRTDSTETGEQSDSVIQICRCSVNNSCGSTVCHMVDTTYPHGQDSGIVLTLKNIKTKIPTPPGEETDRIPTPPGEETDRFHVESVCPCPCAAAVSPNQSKSVVSKSPDFTKTQDTKTEKTRKSSATDHLLASPSSNVQKNLV